VTAPESAVPGDPHPGPVDQEPVGSVAEEAVKLFRAMTSSNGADASARDESSEHVCSTGWCPVCQVVGLVRDHPEAIASVAQSAVQLARSLKDLVDTALAPQEEQ
jgi:hypothetical protein